MEDALPPPIVAATARLEASRSALGRAFFHRSGGTTVARAASTTPPWPLLGGAAAVGLMLAVGPWRRLLSRWALRAGAGWLLRSALKA